MRLPVLVERFLSPGLSTCYRCERPWLHPATRMRWSVGESWWKLYRLPRKGARRVTFHLNRTRFLGLVGVKSHSTPYREGRACFPLCEGCWSEMEPWERLPYYQTLFISWARDAFVHGYELPDSWAEIRHAVIEGL